MAVQLPLYRHPATAVLIDGDRSSLLVLQNQLEHTIIKEVFQTAFAALAWITDAFKHALRLDADQREAVGSGSAVDVSDELSSVYRYVEGPQRFQLPAVLVIEYVLPDMNGVDFCASVAHLPCKKILFTALSDDSVGLDAFNRGLIDRVIRKQQPDSLDQLEAAIDTLQHKFFLEQSRSRAERLEQPALGFLSDPSIASLIRGLCDRYGYAEYYLLTRVSSYLLFDMYGRSTLLVIRTRAALREQSDAGLANGMGPALALDLEEGRVVPFFDSADGHWHDTLPGTPADHCKPAQICHGREEAYYWALFEPPAHFAKSRVYSQARYLSPVGLGAA